MTMTCGTPPGLGSAFAGRLRRRRQEQGLRKQELAARIGVSLTTIQQYENGQLPVLVLLYGRQAHPDAGGQLLLAQPLLLTPAPQSSGKGAPQSRRRAACHRHIPSSASESGSLAQA